MKKIKISDGYIYMFWSPLDGAPDANNELLNLNLNNINSIERLVRELLYVEYNNWSETWKYRCKESFKYAISYSSDKELIHYYNSGAPQIGLPDMFSVRNFYIYVWKFMFGEESYDAANIDNYEIISRFDIYD
ncbi:hypothetical protein [Xenorhabdus bovienii]|uniref:hypothetical protein n=1 Tax=Xenorhabdus bovienii TaxID=40576 RepID=UPI0023B28CB5|nr:hypothetical protein [Xenorhabdus bovienii]MDE9434314.1 hypothetical protein [Xenorhabdus bovienii]MDE9491955.1 hypothetical protein [Xenorhabdus bovienii]MDE9508349.1 hypothetical protein [Xenorhabdus bovienii]MDE9549506.1 hypothetical protein [Xenorhabdus bovienii]